MTAFTQSTFQTTTTTTAAAVATATMTSAFLVCVNCKKTRNMAYTLIKKKLSFPCGFVWFCCAFYQCRFSVCINVCACVFVSLCVCANAKQLSREKVFQSLLAQYLLLNATHCKQQHKETEIGNGKKNENIVSFWGHRKKNTNEK